VPRLVPALAGHVELQLERRLGVVEVEASAAGALERLHLADEDAVHERARALRGGRTVGRHLGRAGVAGRDLGAARIEDAVLDLGADEAVVARELGLREHLLHATDTSCAGSPRLPGPAIPPDANASCSSSCWRRPALSTFSGVSSKD